MIRHDQVGDVCDVLASRFHEAYERLAPSFGYETRTESAKPWGQVPENNRRLMCACAGEVVGPFVTALDNLLAQIEEDLGPTPPSDLPLARVALEARELLHDLGL